MKTIYHPTLPTELEVPDADVDKWVEQGWRKSKPAAVKAAEADAAKK